MPADHKQDSAPEPARPAALQIVPSFNGGGAERTTIDIARALVDAGLRALVASEGGEMEDELRSAGGELIRLSAASKNPLIISRNAQKLVHIIRKRNILLIHARSRAPAWSALIAARLTGIPFVTTYHGIYPAKNGLKRFYNSVMARGDAVIANSEWTAVHVRKTYPKLGKRLVTIPRGLDFHRFDPTAVSAERIARQRQAWGVRAGDRVVLLPGRMTRLKGHAGLIAALTVLKRNGQLPPALRAVIAGATEDRHIPYVEELKRAVAREQLEGAVIFAEHVADMPAAYLAADIVVSTSIVAESFGRIPPEAALMGQPVIATDLGGPRETVLDGVSGLLVPPGDAGALAGALADLLSRAPEQLSAMGAAGRAHVLARFSVERMCADTLALYRDLLEQDRRKATLL
jgi:glycosyltransferase involved in cell wall biosynthesis